MKALTRRVQTILLALSASVALAGGYFSLGYQTAGGLEFGGGGYGQVGQLLLGGEGHGSPAGYGYGLGFFAYELTAFQVEGARGRLLVRLGLGGGGGRGWAGFLIEGGLWLPVEYQGLGAALYLAYQHAPNYAGLLLRVDLGSPAP